MNLLIRLFFLICPLFLYGEIPFLTFQDLQDPIQWNGKEVSVRGFLYFDGKDGWILSPEPHLKSCCVGSKEKRSQQIILEEKYDRDWNHQIVEATGKLNIADGYYLKDEKVSLVKTKNSYFIWFIISAVIFISLKLGKRLIVAGREG